PAEPSATPLQLVGRVIQRREMAQRADIPERPAEILRHPVNRLIARNSLVLPSPIGRICRGLPENRIAKTDERFSGTGSRRKSTQRTKAGHRRQHGDGVALDQPSRVAPPLSSFWLLGDKHLKRQAGGAARRHDDQMLCVLDISRNLAKQRVIDLMCKAKIESEGATINPC